MAVDIGNLDSGKWLTELWNIKYESKLKKFWYICWICYQNIYAFMNYSFNIINIKCSNFNFILPTSTCRPPTIITWCNTTSGIPIEWLKCRK